MPSAASIRATVKLTTLRDLVDAGTVRRVTLVGQRGGYAVLARYGTQKRTLAAKSGEPRLFASIDTAARVLRALGVADFEVNAVNYAPGDPLRRRRPDRSAALKAVHQAAEYDAWFRAQVGQALEEAGDPATRWVPHEAVKTDMAKQRAVLKARIERGGK